MLCVILPFSIKLYGPYIHGYSGLEEVQDLNVCVRGEELICKFMSF